MAYRSDLEIGERIAELLGDRPQADLASTVGMDATALNKVLSGRRGLSGTELVLIARELGVAPQELLIDVEEPVFAMRATADSDAAVREAMEHCARLVDGYLRLEALAPNVA